MAYPARRLFSWAIVLGGIVIAAWNGLPNPLAPIPGKGSWRPYYRGDLSVNQVDQFCNTLETSTNGINEAWLPKTSKSWNAVLFIGTDEEDQNAKVQRAVRNNLYKRRALS